MEGLKLSVARTARLSPVGRLLAAAAALLVFAGAAGGVVAFTGIELPAAAVAAGVAGALAAIALGFLAAGRDRVELRAYAIAAGVVGLAVVALGLLGGGLVEGGAQFANALLVRIGEHTQSYALPYRAGGEGALVAFCAVAGAAGGLACSLFAQRGMAAPVLAVAAAALAGVVSGWLPVGWWALFLATGALAVLCARSLLANDRAARSSYAWALVSALVACALVGGGVGLATRGAPVDAARANGAVQQVLWHMEYGDAIFAMPDGKLGGMGARKASDQEAMKVSVDAPTIEYLRGFVGAAYDANAWEPLDSDSIMDNRDLLYWLDRDGLVGASQLANASGLVDFGEIATSKLDRTMLHVRKPYAYLPYGYVAGAQAHATTDLAQMHGGASGAGTDDDGGLHRGVVRDAVDDGANGGADGQMALFDPGITRKAYVLQDLVDDAQEDAERRASRGADAAKGESEGERARAALLRTYLDDNAAYREFAESQYTSVPDEVAQLFERLYGPAVKLTTEQAKIQVLALLDGTVAYSDDPQALDGEDEPQSATLDGEPAAQRADGAGDFLTDFLTVNQSGYSVHYATAATLLMRYYGVPARYVEGYVLNTAALDETAASAGDEGGSSAAAASDAGAEADESEAAPFLGAYTLTEEQAHAWVEYYLDGVGWVPFDVTPGWRKAGYFETTADAQLVDDSQDWSVGEADSSTVWTPPEAEQQEAEEESEGTAPFFGEMEFLLVLWPWVLAGFLLTMYLAFFARGSILRSRLRKFLAQAEDESVAPEVAVPALFSYLVMLVQSCGGAPLANAPFAGQGAVLEEAGLCSADLFDRVARANDRALFSAADSRVDRDDARAVVECVKSVRAGLRRNVKPLRRFWQRDVRCLW